MLKYFTTLKSNEIKSIAIGGFDGMHLGHKALVSQLCQYGVILVVDKGFSNLTPYDSRCEYVENGCIFIKLKDVKELESYEFVKLLKSEFKNLEKIVVGYDFGYGKNRSGDVKKLKHEFDGEVVVVDEVKIDDYSVHSQVIREFISCGKIKEANRLLGKRYTLTSSTQKGQGVGKRELVATINLLNCNYLLPYAGVYATKTMVKDDWYDSITFIGKRESTDGKDAFETHLIEKKIDFLPEVVEIEFIDFIRENRKFNELRQLKKQIESDIIIAKKIIKKVI